VGAGRSPSSLRQVSVKSPCSGDPDVRFRMPFRARGQGTKGSSSWGFCLRRWRAESDNPLGITAGGVTMDDLACCCLNVANAASDTLRSPPGRIYKLLRPVAEAVAVEGRSSGTPAKPHRHNSAVSRRRLTAAAPRRQLHGRQNELDGQSVGLQPSARRSQRAPQRIKIKPQPGRVVYCTYTRTAHPVRPP
jgi:hypothetical protein